MIHTIDLQDDSAGMPDAVVVKLGGAVSLFKPVGLLQDTGPDRSSARFALLGYMEGQSAERWGAGWLNGLEKALLGDEAYEWLVEAACGWWTWAKSPGTPPVNGRPLAFVPGTLSDLKGQP